LKPKAHGKDEIGNSKGDCKIGLRTKAERLTQWAQRHVTP
jgi:hypothetical protein